jgi:hypothetical protein
MSVRVVSTFQTARVRCGDFSRSACRLEGDEQQAVCGSAQRRAAEPIRSIDMLWTIAVILIVLWLLGLVSSYTLGGFIHILLVLAIVVILVNLIQGRRAL